MSQKSLYLTTYSTQKRATYMLPARFEPEIPASERPHTYALENAPPGWEYFKT
jgi:hypothetical protein